MSFTSDVKNEISKRRTDKIEYISELSAIFRNIAEIGETVKLTTESSSLARRIYDLIKLLYDVNIIVTVRRGYNFSKKYIYILEIKRKKEYILEDLNIVIKNKYLNIPNQYLLDDENSLRAYLRGLFLAVGSVNDPKTSRYHLEFVVDNEEYASYVNNLLNQYNLNSKYLKRENKYMVYIKGAEKISDFLKIIDAPNAVLYYEEIRVLRNEKNNTNRLNNCEIANQEKTIATGLKQLEDIKYLEDNDLLPLLDEKIKEVITYRLKYPETSYQELADIISQETNHKISKSGINHYFRKIRQLAETHRNKVKE